MRATGITVVATVRQGIKAVKVLLADKSGSEALCYCIGEEICLFANLCESSLFALFRISALFVLGDSSVNCSDNTFLYPILRGISSSSYLWNAVDLRLIPDLLTKLFFSRFHFFDRRSHISSFLQCLLT